MSAPDPRRRQRERRIAELFRVPPWIIGITPRPRWWGRVAYYIRHPRSLR